MAGDVVEKIMRQVSMWVDDAYAATRCDVLEDEITEERRFAGAAFADRVEVLSAVGVSQHDFRLVAPFVSRS